MPRRGGAGRAAAELPNAEPRAEYRLSLGGRTWRVRHAEAVLSAADEDRYLREGQGLVPYGAVLWPAAVALAHEVASRAAAFAGRRVLELGAGTGLPGIVAATLGARVTQTDRAPEVVAACRANGARNGVADVIAYREADWSAWGDAERYDWILGADVLYAPRLHAAVRAIFAGNLAAGGRVLVADPFRAVALEALEALAADGWVVTMNKWTVGATEGAVPRPVGVFELAPPG